MSGLDEIGIILDTPDTSSDQTMAILHELHNLLNHYDGRGSGGTIDLLSLPMLPGDYQSLKQLLGAGEINIRLDALGPSDIYETALSGVWWITHRNEAEETIADYIEVTSLPEFVSTEVSQIQRSAQQLEEMIESFHRQE